jgi:hypothetical protein
MSKSLPLTHHSSGPPKAALLPSTEFKRWGLTMKLFYSILLTGLSVFGQAVFAAPVGDCAGTPTEAVSDLPSPLNEWGQLVCTPYGHIISNKDGWIWSYPAAYAPVFIPSQMVQKEPKELGNKSYFTKIIMTKVEGSEFQETYSVFHAGFDAKETLPVGYRLDVASVSGDSLKLYFFDYGDSAWGIWCRDTCDPKLSFMVLNMAKRPNKALQEDAPQAARP